MSSSKVPAADYAVIGGSSTFSLQFPGDLHHPELKIEEAALCLETPYGLGPPLTLFSLGRKRVLSCRMHGWRPGVVARGVASQQLFWIFAQAGVTQILAEGGVGAIHPSLAVRDWIIPDDYIDASQRSDVSLNLPYLLVMRDPMCPLLRAALAEAAEASLRGARRVHEQGVYLNTDGRHFESRAEVRAYRQWGADVIGQSLTPEVYLAREIGACYAGLHLVVNEAEGVGKDWEHEVLAELFTEEAKQAAQILLHALHALPDPQGAGKQCACRSLRKPTLLVDPV